MRYFSSKESIISTRAGRTTAKNQSKGVSDLVDLNEVTTERTEDSSWARRKD